MLSKPVHHDTSRLVILNITEDRLSIKQQRFKFIADCVIGEVPLMPTWGVTSEIRLPH